MKPIIDRKSAQAIRRRPGPFSTCAVLAITAATASAQFTNPYSGVGPSVRSTPLPIVVMKYEPNTPFSYERYMLFGRDGNRLIQIAKDRSSTWYKRTEVPFRSGLVPASDPVPFRNPDGSIASLFVLGSDGIIYQSIMTRYDDEWRSWSPLPSNAAMASTCGAVNTPDGSGVSANAIGRDGALYNVFYARGGGGGWGSWARVPGSPLLVGRPAVVNSSDGLEMHVFATNASGAMSHVRFIRGGSGGWSTWRVLPGESFVGSPSCYALGNLVSVFGTGTDRQVHQAVYSNGSWGAWSSLGGPSTGTFVGGPAAVNSPNEQSLDIVARTNAGIVERRTYTRGGGGGWSSWSPLDTGGTLTDGPTFANWHSRTATEDQTRAQMFGASQSVAHWFDENSQGKYTVKEAFISDWLLMPDDPNTPVNESSYEYFHGPDYAGKARLMIQAFEGRTGFRFASYDTNRDGKVTTDELMVYWIYPGESARVRGTPLCIPVPSLSGCGVSLDLGLPRSAAHIAPATICEELCHALFGLDDLYETSALPSYVGPGQLTLISNNAAFPHLHPWGKMKLGWVAPTVVTQDGWYALRPIEHFPDLLVVHNAARGPGDYFLVENRWPDGSIEHALPDRGVGVWRIGEHYQGMSYWGRRTIQLLRAGGGKDDTVAFWDASDPRTAYHLTPTSAPADTRWDDGSRSDIAIYHFPAATNAALVYVDLPPLRGAPPPPHRKASYDYIDQPPPYRNQSPTWLTAQTLPILGTTLQVRIPASYASGVDITTFYLATGVTSPGAVHPLLGGYLFASLDLLMPAPFGSQGQMTTMSLAIPNNAILTGLSLYQQTLRIVAGQGFPLAVSRGGHMVLGY